MLWFKQSRKGYIVVYTIIILSLLLSIVLLSFKVELMRKKYNDMSIETQILENRFEKERAYLLSKTSKYIKENLGSKALSNDEVHTLLIVLNKVEFEDSFLEYNKNNKKIVLSMFNDEGERKTEYYYCIIESETNKITFITTVP